MTLDDLLEWGPILLEKMKKAAADSPQVNTEASRTEGLQASLVYEPGHGNPAGPFFADH